MGIKLLNRHISEIGNKYLISKSYIVGTLAVLRTSMRPVVTDRVALSVGLSVGLSVTFVSPAKQLNRSRCRLDCGLGWA